MRAEDALELLRLHHNTFGLGNRLVLEQVGGPVIALELRNNLFLTGLPEEARGGGNRASGAEAVTDATGHDYRLAPGSPAVDAGIQLTELVLEAATDADGATRRGLPDAGAYEAR